MSLDKGLRRLEGVEKTQLNTEKPVHVDVTLKPGFWIEPEKFFKQIGDAGYQARKNDVRFTLTGKIVRDDDRLLLIVEDLKTEPQKFILVEGKIKKNDEAKMFADAFQEASEKAEQTVELEGEWKAADKKDKTSLPTLIVRRVGLVKPKADM